jgi:hypothetical protein
MRHWRHKYQARRTLLVPHELAADRASMDSLVLGGGAVILSLWPGRTFVATVLRVGPGGAVVALAGCELGVRLADGVAVTVGQVVTLEAVEASGGPVRLRLRS